MYDDETWKIATEKVKSVFDDHFKYESAKKCCSEILDEAFRILREILTKVDNLTVN